MFGLCFETCFWKKNFKNMFDYKFSQKKNQNYFYLYYISIHHFFSISFIVNRFLSLTHIYSTTTLKFQNYFQNIKPNKPKKKSKLSLQIFFFENLSQNTIQTHPCFLYSCFCLYKLLFIVIIITIIVLNVLWILLL